MTTTTETEKCECGHERKYHIYGDKGGCIVAGCKGCDEFMSDEKTAVHKLLDEWARGYASQKTWKLYKWHNERDWDYCPQPEALEKLATIAYNRGFKDGLLEGEKRGRESRDAEIFKFHCTKHPNAPNIACAMCFTELEEKWEWQYKHIKERQEQARKYETEIAELEQALAVGRKEGEK